MGWRGVLPHPRSLAPWDIDGTPSGSSGRYIVESLWGYYGNGTYVTSAEIGRWAIYDTDTDSHIFKVSYTETVTDVTLPHFPLRNTITVEWSFEGDDASIAYNFPANTTPDQADALLIDYLKTNHTTLSLTTTGKISDPTLAHLTKDERDDVVADQDWKNAQALADEERTIGYSDITWHVDVPKLHVDALHHARGLRRNFIGVDKLRTWPYGPWPSPLVKQNYEYCNRDPVALYQPNAAKFPGWYVFASSYTTG